MKNITSRLFPAIVAAIFAVTFSACIARSSECKHRYDQWVIERGVTCTSSGLQTRTCEKCGYTDSQITEALGHVEVTDAAVAATCTTDGKTEGKHCSVCGTVITAQTVVAAHGHTEVIDAAVEATCTSAGLTEGRHCSVCGVTIAAQSETALAAHNYDEGIVVAPATCISEGTIEYTCLSCGDIRSESYSLPTITATELYTQSIEYVGEITVYDKNGTGLGKGTGFVISSDGAIVTNYHVIDGAYYAEIALNGNVYEIETVLAYDALIDLAVVKIEASNLTTATLCKNPVKVGETVYTLGSSRGLTNTYAQGIITYAERVIDGVTYVQHDAAMSPGNSGGPLINSYGEVIGINTFLLLDAQNLNFSVFVAELDRLNYTSPMSLIDVYQLEKKSNTSKTFETLKNAIEQSGRYDESIGAHVVYLGSTEEDVFVYERRAYYYPDKDIVTLDLVIYENGETAYWVYFELTEDLSGVYDWEYFDASDRILSGEIIAETYNENTLLGYDYHENFSTQEELDTIRHFASSMVDFLCYYLSDDLEPIDITAADLGFIYY